MKNCTQCGIEKPQSEFYKSAKSKNGLSSICKSCQKIKSSEYYIRNKAQIIQKTKKWAESNAEKRKFIARKSHLNKTFNLTEQQVQELKISQNGGCAICKTPLLEGYKTHIDHCHTTGKIRGLLCNSCNRGLGFFKDSIPNLKQAIEYLTWW